MKKNLHRFRTWRELCTIHKSMHLAPWYLARGLSYCCLYSHKIPPSLTPDSVSCFLSYVQCKLPSTKIPSLLLHRPILYDLYSSLHPVLLQEVRASTSANEPVEGHESFHTSSRISYGRRFQGSKTVNQRNTASEFTKGTMSAKLDESPAHVLICVLVTRHSCSVGGAKKSGLERPERRPEEPI